MKTTTFTLLAVLFLGLALSSPAADILNETLQKGLFEEEANHNLEAAIQAYQAVVQHTDEQRKLAATAIFRLGECYRKLGKTNDATAQFERILQEFSGETTLATLSRQNLAGLGMAPKALAPRAASKAARLEQKRLLDEEIKLVEQQRELVQKQIATGLASREALIPITREILELRRQLAGLDLGADEAAATLEPLGQTASTDEEEKEVQRIKALIKDSPDLINSGSGPDGKTPLHKAAQAGQLVVARFLLANKANVDARTDKNVTPLHYAAYAGHKSMLEFLLANGASVNASGGLDLGGTPLHAAAKHGFRSVAEVLIASKADLEARNDAGQTPLHVAAEGGHKPVIELLLAKGADINAKSASGWTPLHYAVKRNDPSLVDLFLSRKAEVTAKDKDGLTALSWAVEAGSSRIAEVLLNNGADANSIGRSGDPLLHVAISHQSPETLKLLLVRKPDLEIHNHDGFTPLQAAVLENAAVDLIQVLLAGGAEVNAPYKQERATRTVLPNQTPYIGGCTPLIVATLKGKVKVVESLLAHGAEVNSTDAERMTALQYAAGAGSLPVVLALLAHHADTEARAGFGTALLRAQDPHILEALLNAGAKVDAKSSEGNTALHYAVENRSLPRVTTILAHHPDTEIRDKEGYTPLRRAQFEDLKIMEALIGAGADLNSVVSDGNSPLHYAVAARRKDIVELLVTNKADVNLMNREGETPLMWTQKKEPPGRALRVVPPPGGSSAEPAEYASMDEIATFLLRHGADESIPRRSFISVSRKERNLTNKVFFKGTNAFNHFTLFEAIAAAYRANPGSPTFPFPDVANVKIKRLSAKPGGNDEINVDLAKIFESGECRGDLDLEWGDLVRIPELDHGVNEQWPGLTHEKIEMLRKCLKRESEIIVKGEHTKLTLMPDLTEASNFALKLAELQVRAQAGVAPAPVRDSWRNIMGFRLKDVVNQANVVRLSSDLSRVKVKRADPKSGQAQELVFNLSEGAPYDTRTDLWLRDGDVIEIPEK